MGLLGNLFGGAQMKKASKKAAAAQTAALQGGIDTLNKQFGTVSGYYDPYRTGGEQAFGQYGDLLGLHGGDTQQSAIDALRASPYFQSLYNQGQEAILQNASATGGLRGGDTQHSLYDLGNQTLAQTIQQQLQNLGGTAQSFGMGSVGALGNLGAANAQNVAELLNAQGQAKAQDILTRGSINNSVWSGIGSALLGSAFAAAGLPPGMGSALGGGGGGGGGFGSLFGGGNANIGMGGGGGLGGLFRGGSFGGAFGGNPVGSPNLGAMMPVGLSTSPLTYSGGSLESMMASLPALGF